LKSNIGHAQAAAGVAGVIKMVLAMRHATLPQTLHVDAPSSKVDWSAGAVQLLTEQTPWPEVGHPRRAGVSSFGVSGTNAHVILEQAPGLSPETESESDPDDGTAVPVVVSARSAQGLAAQADRLAAFLETGQRGTLSEVARALLTTRAGWEHRAVVVAQDVSAAVDGLRGVAAGRSVSGVITGMVRPSGVGKTVLVFPGQGGQWVGMGRQLWESEPVFAARMAECEQALAPYVDWSLSEVISDGLPLDRVDVLQPVSWAVMVSLAALWRSCGVRPDAVVGHSQGEVAAACVAGALSLSDAARVVAVRAQLIGELLSGHGKVLSVAASVDEIGALPEFVSVAAVNGPNSLVLSGVPEAMDAVADRLTQAGVTCRWVNMDFPSHSAQMERLRVPLLEQLADISAGTPVIPMMSTVDGGWIAGPVDAEYWMRNAREQVRFGDAIEALAGQGFGVFVECGSHPVLTTAVQDIVGDDALVVGTLRRDQGDRARFLRSLAELFVRGVPVDWPWRRVKTAAVPVPTSVFQHEHYWLTPEGVTDAAGLGQAPVPHPVLRAAVENPDTGGVVLTGRLALGTHPWLADHVVAGAVLVPGAALVEFAIQGGDRVGTPVLDELMTEAPMVVPEDSALHVQVTVGVAEEATGRRTVAIHSRPDRGHAEWTRHATGFLTDDIVVTADVEAPWPPEGAQPIEVGDLYDTLSARGYHYGPAFQGLNRAWRRDGELFAEVTLPPQVDAAGFVIHPALLDAALHTSCLGAGTDDGLVLPFAWNRVVAHAAAAGTVRVRSTSDAGGAVAIELTDPAGKPVLSVESLVSRPVSADQFAPSGNSPLFGVNWTALPVEIGASVEAAVITGPDDLAAFAVGQAAPWVVLRPDPGPVEADPGRARAVVGSVLATLQAFLTEPAWVDSRLVVTTRLGVAIESAEVPDPVAAAVWGLVRAAHAEHPGRVLLADLDTEADLPLGLLEPMVATGEWQLALRGNRVLVPRLAIVADPGENPTRSFDSEGTVVITGGPASGHRWRGAQSGTGLATGLAGRPCARAGQVPRGVGRASGGGGV
jgi:acyl transferase domain-containing protein